MGVAADEAKLYLKQKQIPLLFESLMTGLMYHKPEDPIDFMQRAVYHIHSDPANIKVEWDMFIDHPPPPLPHALANGVAAMEHQTLNRSSPALSGKKSSKTPSPVATSRNSSRAASVFAAAHRSKVPDVPVILFIGGPGGGKTKHAVRVSEEFKSEGLVHVCLPKLIRDGISKHRGKYKEWTEAADNYEAGELIPANLAMALIKAEMGRHPDAQAYLIEGFPREMSQMKEFEKEIKRVDMALILDYDEETLRRHMRERELSQAVLDKRVEEFKAKSLPAAKYFDDKYLLYLIPGEKGDEGIYEEMKQYVQQALSQEIPPPQPIAPAADTVPEPPAQTSPVPAAAPPPLPAAAVEAAAEEEEEVEDDDDVPKGLPNDAPVVLVIGAPGSKKSEYCKRLAKRYDGFVHLSMGELIRQETEARKDDSEWQELIEGMNKGELLPTVIESFLQSF